MPVFHLVSDTHVDHLETLPHVEDFKEDEKYALLAGDIGDPFQPSYKAYIAKVASLYTKVFVITGNHEYDMIARGRDRNQTAETFRDIEQYIRGLLSDIPNVVFLQKETYKDKTFRILGCTLWSHPTFKAAVGVNRFGLFSSIEEWSALHNDHKQWLLDTIPKSNLPTFILVHFGPLEVMSGDYAGSDINSAFTNNIPELFIPPVAAVCSGHVHSNVITHLDNILSASNAMGYTFENQKKVRYNPKFLMKLN